MTVVQTLVVLIFFAIGIGLVARRIGMPYPVALVLGGLVLGFIRQLPNLEFDPDYVFFFFLPPLLYHAAVFTSWRDFRHDIGSISLLAVGLVAATTVAVAAVAHSLIPGMPWAAAVALGAIVSPPDAICATAAMANTKIPRRLVTVIEGESLVNDASGLVIYKYAVLAAVTGGLSAWDAAADFIVVGPGGIAIGAILGFLLLRLQRRVVDPMIEVTVSLTTPFAVYIVADRLGTSGVLAVVTAGLIRGWYAPEVLTPQTRIRAFAAWDVLVFILNSIVFILIGSELDDIVQDLPSYSLRDLLSYSLAVSATAILVRFLWVFASVYLARFLPARWRGPKQTSWREAVILAWSGMRGVVSLAAALALLVNTASGEPFPARELTAFLTFAVIFVTLVIQGLTIAPLARWLGVKADDISDREERLARHEIVRAALAEVERAAPAAGIAADVLAAVRAEIVRQIEETAAMEEGAGDTEKAAAAKARRDLLLAAIAAQRRELIRLRRKRAIGDDVMHRIERELDLQEAMLSEPVSAG